MGIRTLLLLILLLIGWIWWKRKGRAIVHRLTRPSEQLETKLNSDQRVEDLISCPHCGVFRQRRIEKSCGRPSCPQTIDARS